LAEDVADIVADSALAQVQRFGDFAVCLALADELQYLHLLVGEVTEGGSLLLALSLADFLKHALREHRIEEGFAAPHGFNSTGEVVTADLLEHVASGPGADEIGRAHV